MIQDRAARRAHASREVVEQSVGAQLAGRPFHAREMTAKRGR